MAPRCLFKSITGCPCPACGSTRALSRLVRGDLLGAAMLNPLVVTLLLALPLVVVATTLWSWRNTHSAPTHIRASRWTLWTLAGIALTANWAYVIWRGN